MSIFTSQFSSLQNPALESFVEELVKALSHKSPGVKIQTGLFLSRRFPTMDQTAWPKTATLAKTLAEPLVKVLCLLKSR